MASDRAGRVSERAGRASDRAGRDSEGSGRAEMELGGPQRELRGPWETGALVGWAKQMDSLLPKSNRTHLVVSYVSIPYRDVAKKPKTMTK